MKTTVNDALVYKARNFIEARALAAYLGNGDIDAHVVGDVIPNVFGVQNIGPSSGAEVWVPGAQRAKAEELIRGWQAEYGSAEQVPELKSQFALKSIFKVVAVVALVAATARVIKSWDRGIPAGRTSDLQYFVTAGAIWFWTWVAKLSARFTLRKWRRHEAVEEELSE